MEEVKEEKEIDIPVIVNNSFKSRIKYHFLLNRE